MTQNLHQMTNAELKQYLSDHRNDEESFRSALQILISRRAPNALRQPYPFDLADPESEVKAILKQKVNQTMVIQPINTAYYTLSLLINLGDSPTGGTLEIETYTFDPKLAKGDSVHIKDWKVGVVAETGLENQAFSFDATVIDVHKTVVRHEYFIVNIILESPDREMIAQLRDTLKAMNPEQFPS